jgi:AcrR family transcriptional regulator
MHGGEAVMKGDFQRWTAKRKAELVLEILRGDLSVAQACKRFDLDESNLQSWIDTFLQTGERSLKSAKHRGAVEGQAAAEQRPAKTKQTSQALRKEPKSRTSREIVESIQQACIRILEREGVDALTTNRIAEVAGVSVGSLYQYYALERDLSASTMNAFRARVKASISERSFRETLAEFFEAVIDRHRRMLRLAPSHYLEHLREYDLDKFIKERYRARLTTEVWLEYLVGLYSDRIGESGDFELKSFVAMRGVIGALNAVVEDRPELLESPMLRDELVELVLRYFAYEEDASD